MENGGIAAFFWKLRIGLTLWKNYLQLQTSDGTPPGNAGLRTGFFKKRIIYDWNEKQPAGTETGVPGKNEKCGIRI